MILFFHFICLLARYIFNNISKSLKTDSLWEDEGNESEFSKLRKTLGYVKSPVYENDTLMFFPPVYVQRYETVAIILKEAAEKFKIRKVVDFGCAELGFLMYMKNIEGIREILEVDIDADVLERSSFKAAPLTSDYLMGKRDTPLDVYVLAGSVGDFDDHLIGCDAVICIELIEHLVDEDFEAMPFNIFYKIKPKIAVFTTPNADFNSLLPNFSGFRHDDHKFEWTRKEFNAWGQEIINQYPEYSVKYFGIGAGPEGSESLGCCSQVAVFTLNGESDFFFTAREEPKDVFNYRLINHYKYPYYVDSRSLEQKILHEVLYQAAYLSTLETYYNYENNESEIPISTLKEYVSDVLSDEELVIILNNNGMDVRMKKDTLYLVWSDEEYNPVETSSKSGDWLNREMSDSFNDKDLLNKDTLSDDENDNSEINMHHSSWSVNELQTISVSRKIRCDSMSKSDYQNLNICQSSEEISKELQRSESKNEGIKIVNSLKSRIPLAKNRRYGNAEESRSSFIYKPKISRSLSLDSCLENINCKPLDREGFLSLIPGVSSGFFSAEGKHVKNYSGSSLLSSSLDRAGDSGYPHSSPNDNLTPEQLDEIWSENEMMSRSTSTSSEMDKVDVLDHRFHHDVFVEDIPVENGDLANNNRDGEGNNVEGLMGQRLVNEVAIERDPNDNLFFPEIEEFPPWLLNLGGLALAPVYLPLEVSDNDEGVGDDSSSGFNHSLDLEDVDIDLPSCDCFCMKLEKRQVWRSLCNEIQVGMKL